MLVLTETDIRRLISTGDALAAASDALMRDSLDEFVIPSRLTVRPRRVARGDGGALFAPRARPQGALHSSLGADAWAFIDLRVRCLV